MIVVEREEFFDLEHRFQKHYNFLSAMVHDLKTPLSAILGFAELLQEERISGELNQKQEKFLLLMNDGNSVYVDFKNFQKLNKYIDIIKSFGNKKGILNLDSGNNFEFFE